MVTLTLRSTSPAAIDRLKAQMPIAQARALNRAIASAKTAMVRVVSRDMGLKSGDVSDRIGTEEARPDRLRARLSASYAKIPLIKFGASGPNPSHGRGRVTAITGGRAAGEVGVRHAIPGAFLATLSSGHVGVFKRTGKSRLPIRQLHGPSVAQVFVKYVDVGLARGEEQLLKELSSQFRFAIRPTA